MEIPKEYIAVCKDIGKVARKHKLSALSGSFRPPIMENRQIRMVTFNWNAGRHNADTGVISIHAEMWIDEHIDEQEEQKNERL